MHGLFEEVEFEEVVGVLKFETFFIKLLRVDFLGGVLPILDLVM